MSDAPTFRLFRGLPGSGKTTLARAWVAEDPTTRARVNRDDLRAMLHGRYVPDAERRQVAAMRDSLIDGLLRQGVSVACDDTNLPQRVARELCALATRAGAHVWVTDLTDVPLALCIARDYDRGELAVGEDVIRGMHERYLAGRSAPLPDPRVTQLPEPVDVYVPDTSLPPAWLVDIDGTLAHMDGRGPFDWHRVGEDSCNEAVREVVWALTVRHRIVLLSGRDECCRDETATWLIRHGIDWDALLMRPAGDTRKDAVVKLELFREHVAPRYNVRGVLDDRDQVVALWRSLGLMCAQVAEGNF